MRKHSGKSAFFISKPLQLMVALCIAQQDAFDSKPVFVIVDSFNGAREVADMLFSEFTELQTPEYFKLRSSALSFLKKQNFDNLFIDSDIGLKNFLTLASFKLSNPNISIHVFEEGLGTYRTDLYSGIKKTLFSLIGIGVFFGACRFVNSIYVYHKEEYIEKIPTAGFKAQQIRNSLFQFLTINSAALNRLFSFHGIKPSSPDIPCCTLYLSSWSINKEFIENFHKLEGDLFIKLHPHIRTNVAIDGIQFIDARVPAELLLIELITNYKSVQVYDHNSSVRRYIKKNNLTFSLAENKPNAHCKTYNA